MDIALPNHCIAGEFYVSCRVAKAPDGRLSPLSTSRCPIVLHCPRNSSVIELFPAFRRRKTAPNPVPFANFSPLGNGQSDNRKRRRRTRLASPWGALDSKPLPPASLRSLLRKAGGGHNNDAVSLAPNIPPNGTHDGCRCPKVRQVQLHQAQREGAKASRGECEEDSVCRLSICQGGERPKCH